MDSGIHQICICPAVTDTPILGYYYQLLMIYGQFMVEIQRVDFG